MPVIDGTARLRLEQKRERDEFMQSCARVARLFTRTAEASQEDADFVLALLRSSFRDRPSMMTYELTPAGQLVLAEVFPDSMVHVREGQRSVLDYIDHAIAVGTGQIRP